MSLFVVSTPIGNDLDISFRAVDLLKSVNVVIGEERKVVSKLLKRLDIKGKTIELLNEHSNQADVRFLLSLCKKEDVCLVSDCGTPGFCDPGANLVAACRRENVSVRSVPGASSLMSFISLCGLQLNKFIFEGFLPANSIERLKRLEELKNCKFPTIIMDTPYRLLKLLESIFEVCPNNQLILGLELTKDDELMVEGLAYEILKKIRLGEIKSKAEFILMIMPRINNPSLTLKSTSRGRIRSVKDSRRVKQNRSNKKSTTKRKSWAEKKRSGKP